jgi:hypothetical protein
MQLLMKLFLETCDPGTTIADIPKSMRASLLASYYAQAYESMAVTARPARAAIIEADDEHEDT